MDQTDFVWNPCPACSWWAVSDIFACPCGKERSCHMSATLKLICMVPKIGATDCTTPPLQPIEARYLPRRLCDEVGQQVLVQEGLKSANEALRISEESSDRRGQVGSTLSFESRWHTQWLWSRGRVKPQCLVCEQFLCKKHVMILLSFFILPFEFESCVSVGCCFGDHRRNLFNERKEGWSTKGLHFNGSRR